MMHRLVASIHTTVMAWADLHGGHTVAIHPSIHPVSILDLVWGNALLNATPMPPLLMVDWPFFSGLACGNILLNAKGKTSAND